MVRRHPLGLHVAHTGCRLPPVLVFVVPSRRKQFQSAFGWEILPWLNTVSFHPSDRRRGLVCRHILGSSSRSILSSL